MKARLPKGFAGGGAPNLQQLAMKAQKMQDEMDAITRELEGKEYQAAAPDGSVQAVVSGGLEVRNITISPDAVKDGDAEMLADMVILAVNGAIRKAVDEKNEKMTKLSGELGMPGMF